MGGPPSCIWLVSPPGTVNGLCFTEVVLALHEGFAALGFDVPVVTDPRDVRGRALVVNPALLEVKSARPDSLILYNMEQVSETTGWFDAAYVELLKKFPVWDYSPLNILLLREKGINATLCEVGYSPGLSRIQPARERDLDVVFVGAFHKRRDAILQALHSAGVNVVAASQCFGKERDALYARAKIVLNLHMLDARIFEIVRCSYLLANRICVVSETGSDEALEAPVRGGVAFAPYEKLVETCLQLLEDEEARARIAEAGFRKFSRRSQAHALRNALAEMQSGADAGRLQPLSNVA
jgi:hypothetical protein